MATATNPFLVVVGIDFSVQSDRALDQALEMASLREDAEVHVVCVEPEWAGAAFATPLPPVDEAVQEVQQRAAERVTAMGRKLDGGRLKRVIAHVRRGTPAVEIARLAAELDADLVVVGSHGRGGIQRLFLGSVAEHVARLARCPVWVIRPKNHYAAGPVPEIEPPCPECVTRREATGGEALWCERHSEHHVRPHRYSHSTRGMYAAETTVYESTPGM
jgi:nucleotide-binding universal stress UspA family protein